LVDPDGRNPGIAIGGVALTAGEATVLVCTGIAATASAVGADNIAKIARGTADLVENHVNKPIIEGIKAGLGWLGEQLGITSTLAGEGAPTSSTDQAPPANNGEAAQHGKADHDQQVNEEVQQVKEAGHTDIRKNQAQVNANGEKVDKSRPDVQSTDKSGKRKYVEVDRNVKSNRKHEARIKKNDPDGSFKGVILR
jgi:hypothetical protein